MVVGIGDARAQVGRGKITAAEFFFDTDPGQGAGTAVSLQGNANDLLRTAIQSATVTLAAGKHTINIRIKDSLNHWSPVFKTTLSVENAGTARSINVNLARMYWDANIAGATNLVIYNGNVGDAINSFVNSTPLATFPTAGSHKISVQVLDASAQWSTEFTTVIAVESPASFTRIISAVMGRAYWDSNLGSSVGLLIINGNAGNAINNFITATALSSFSSAGSHKLNVQLLDPNGSGNYSQAFSTVVKFDTALNFTRLISAALGRAWWDNNLSTSVGLIIVNGNAGNAINDFATATPLSSFTTAGLHKLNVQLLDPNGSGNYSPTFSTAIKFDNLIDSVRALRVDMARIWIDNNQAGAINMIAFDGNYNDPIEAALQTMTATTVGLHTLNVQMRDSIPTNWGPVFKTVFVADNPLSYRNINVATGQLYWDNDTLNNPMTLLAFDGNYDNAIESGLKNNVPVLPAGLHTLCVRFKDVANNWSSPFKLIITIEDSLFARDLKVVQGEVRVDNAPPVVIVALNGAYNNALEQAQATILSSGIPVGMHKLITRFKGLDGAWGKSFTTAIVVSPCASTPTPTVTNNRPLEFCYGDSTILTANSGYTSYQWIYNSTVVGTGQSFVARDSGNYVVIVTDATNCPGASIPMLVNVHHPIVNITTSPIFCSGTTDSLLATAGFNAYSWSSGSTTRKQIITTGGTYSVTVVDAYGCSGTSSIIINALTPPPVPTISLSGPTALCAGSNVTLTSSASNNILWNNGLSIPSFTVDTAGYFAVTVTGANGCKSTSAGVQTSVFPYGQVSISPSGPITICAGENVTLSATPSLTYLWSTGATTSSITTGVLGTYSVSVIDSNGCPANSNVVSITVNPVPATPIVSASGPLSFCNGGSVILTSSAATNNIWSNGFTGQAQTITQSGIYIDTVYNVFGCKSWSTPTNVNVHPTASIAASGPTTFCFGNNVLLTASPASGVSYLWSNGATSQSVTISNTQNLSVITTETGGCSDTAYTNVLVHALPTGNLTAAGPTTVCSGSSVVMNATGSAHTGFRWFLNGSPIIYYSYNIYCNCLAPYFVYGATFSATGSGNYSVEIIDSVTGCVSMSNVIPVTIIVPTQPVITANGGTTICISANTILSSSPAVSYLWSTGATTQTITAATQGTYYVTTTDIYGCQSTSVNTPVTFFPVATITANGPTTFCAGGNVSLTAHPLGTYLWTNGSSNASINNITSNGTYGVTVTDVNGCTSTATPVDIVVNPLPSGSITAAGPTTVCLGNGVTFNATGSANTKFRWFVNGGPITNYFYSIQCACYVPYYTYGSSFSTGTAGVYSAEIIDTLTGCVSMSNSFTVNILPLPTPTITQTATIPCNGGSNAALFASATGTVSPYTFLWSTGSTNPAISNLVAGNYYVTATDANTCSASVNYQVNQPNVVSALASTPTNTRGYNVSCFGSTDGSATVYPSGGTSPYTFIWSTGATTQTINGIGAGTYTVTVHDANNCAQATTTVTLVQPAAVGITLTKSLFYGGSNISCNGGSNGSISATPSGGTANFTYLWSNGQVTQTASNLSVGTYSVVITDSVGCTTSASATLTQPAVLSKTITKSNYTGYGVSCFGSNNGFININPIGGTAPYHYYWTDTAYTQNRTSLTAKTYHVIITDTLGCSISDSIVITQPTQIVSTTTGSMLNCFGDSNGVATVIVNGGNAPYTYVWSSGSTSSTATNLKANFYLVTVSDSRGCTHVNQAEVQQPTQVNAYAFGTFIGCGTQIGLLSVTGSGGFGPYTYLWSNGSTASFQTNQPIGTYSVSVTDTHGCWDTATAIILSPPTLTASVSDFHTNCDSITTVPAGTLTVNVSGGVTPYLYYWSNGETTQTINNLGTGTYSVIVTDANGCTVVPVAGVFNNDPASIIGEDTICNGNLASLSTLPGLAFTWSNSGGVVATTQSVSLGAGTYTLTATNLNGCVNTDSVTVVSQQCNTYLNLKAYLQSYYDAGGFMHPVLMNQSVGSNSSLTDSITVELHASTPPYAKVVGKKVLLNTNGTTATIQYPTTIGSYYIVVKHRNAVETWSADSIYFGVAPVNYDFTTAASKAYGDNMIEMESGKWAFYSGDLILDGNVDLLDVSKLDLDIANFMYGYFATDMNGDGNVDILDIPLLELNVNSFISVVAP